MSNRFNIVCRVQKLLKLSKEIWPSHFVGEDDNAVARYNKEKYLAIIKLDEL